MKTLFAHDARFLAIGDEVRTDNQFGAYLWPRYLAHFDGLTVVARRTAAPDADAAGKLVLSSAPNVHFELLDDQSNLRALTINRPAALRRMTAMVKAHDAVIARLPSEIGLLAVAAARATGTPYAIECVGCAWDGLWNYGSLAGRLYAPVAMWRNRRALRNATHVVYVTSQFLQRRYPTRADHVAAISNVGIGDAAPEVLARRVARIASMDNRPLRLGLIGTLQTQYKGIQVLLAAMAKLSADAPAFHLHILGGGDAAPWRALANRLGVGHLVSFDGSLPSGQPVMNWLDETDIYLQPSLTEGLPRALIEAMSRGCPALGSTAGGIPELLPESDLVRANDVPALARRLAEALQDREWMKNCAARNWEEAKSYQASILEARRHEFWRTFRNAAQRPPTTR